ncbi:putative bifunctional diguanylate cyclase/phosphodiesterase [Parasulfuritortus cantonensis]|nr:EAL domain-containing protein [Parasulfuritortus cantonensis]
MSDPAQIDPTLLGALLGQGSVTPMAVPPARLLLVDDEPVMRHSLQRLFAKHDYLIESVGSGQAAIERLDQQQFDLMLLDLHLADMHGLDVLRHAKRRGIDLLTIVVSGDNEIDSAIGALRQGAYGFLRKPAEPDELLAGVTNALALQRERRENERMRDRLAQSERLYRYLVEQSPDFIYTLDQEGRFNFVNQRVESLLGYRREDLIGKHYSVLVHPEDLARARHVLDERRTGDRASRNVELRLRGRTPEDSHHFEVNLVTLSVNAFGVYSQDGEAGQREFVGTYGIARDISERRKAEAMAAFHALYDRVTELPNRELFHDRLEFALIQSRRQRAPLAVMLIDLDRFKWVNDSLGHLVGDDLLRVVAQRIAGCLDGSDTLARLDADEFALLSPHIPDAAAAKALAKRILGVLGAPCEVGGHEVFLTASIGIAMSPEDGNDAQKLMRNADVALHYVKQGGKNNYARYASRMPDLSSVKHGQQAELRRAVRKGELVLYYQPQVDANNGDIVGVEALMRWQHPRDGLRGAGDIFPLAEEIGLVCQLSDWLLETACADLRAWLDRGLARISMAVNISPHYLDQDDFVERVLAAVTRHGLAPESLKLEITEGIAIRNVDDAAGKLSRLAAAGVRLAIDDFGTGYSSLAYLQMLPLHTLKIDKAFVNEIHDDSQRVPVVQAIIALARGLGLEVVGEGVEREEQARFLLRNGCHIIQGFLYHRPQPAAAVAALLAAQAHQAQQA